jgi:hypothetical protein
MAHHWYSLKLSLYHTQLPSLCATNRKEFGKSSFAETTGAKRGLQQKKSAKKSYASPKM